jgi:hypothetical protein
MLQFSLSGEVNCDEGNEDMEYTKFEDLDMDDDEEGNVSEDENDYDYEEVDENDEDAGPEEVEGNESNGDSGMEEENKPFKRKYVEVSLIQCIV